ncbi:MAG: hypothetical protein KAG96_01725 [Ichthyobacteriaceae bacterium]|nr:hypothetical protein [Ichthyobacteriaceae bacterium]
MHEIEPFYKWRNKYISAEDEQSPFYGQLNSETHYTHSIYNHYIHPQWDTFGSETLVAKQIWADYNHSFTIIELMGEWNDLLYNDVMYLKTNIIDAIIESGVDKFIFITENVLNFHFSDDLYYAEWLEEIPDGWIVFVNTQNQIITELNENAMENYINYNEPLNKMSWRSKKPLLIFDAINSVLNI